jgi:hypothetical protein
MNPPMSVIEAPAKADLADTIAALGFDYDN